MRKFLVIVILVAAGFAIPTATSAKGAAGLTISGSGVTRELEPLDRSISAIVEQTHFYETLWEPEVHAFSLATWAPTDDLGPRLVLAWDMDHDGSAPGPDVPFLQSLYPYAAGGPLVRTAAGQDVYLEPVAGGWHRADAELISTLRRLDVLPRSPERGTWFFF